MDQSEESLGRLKISAVDCSVPDEDVTKLHLWESHE
jgi:hypothetical protein